MEVALVVLDGWGLGAVDDPAQRNAVADAETPHFDKYTSRGAYGELTVSGRSVGLPEKQMGNSEVGHLNIGAGRVVYQEYTRINDAMAAAGFGAFEDHAGVADAPDPPFDQNPAIESAIDHVDQTGGRIHLLGLVSDGGVHSDYRHLFALIELAARRDVAAVTHAFTDGRDTDPKAGVDYLRALEEVIERHGTGDVATVTGRYYAMDRDQNWERTRRAYDAVVDGEAAFRAETASAAAAASYDRGVTDEFIEPTLIDGGAPVHDDDAIIFFNFRSDRARQLTRMLAGIRPADWEAEDITVDSPVAELTTMTEYDRTFDLPVAFRPIQPEETIGEVLAAANSTQLRIAESEKYAHVTYFLNGGRELEFEGEVRKIIPSPDVPTYDLQPEMSAPAVTDAAIEITESADPDAMILNYANPDMVGHTGDYEAAIRAVEAVDTQLARLIEAIQGAGGHSLLTADHGNAENMGTAEAPHTAHTRNDVPFVSLTPQGTDGGHSIPGDGRLADLAPTMLDLMGIPAPARMTGQSLLRHEG